MVTIYIRDDDTGRLELLSVAYKILWALDKFENG